MSNDEHRLEERTKLPTEVEEEDPFISIAELRLSLRQCLTLAMSFAAWAIAIQVTVWILPIAGIFAGLLWSWLIIAGIVLTFVKKDGRPYEEYLSQWVSFQLSDRYYILKDSKKEKYGSIEDADWDELDDDFYR